MLIAEHTTEATRIEVHDGFVYKFLRAPDSGSSVQPELRLWQLRFRAAESQLWPELNSILFDEARYCFISPYLQGTIPTRQQLRDLRHGLDASGRGYIQDLGRSNVIVFGGEAILIDFAINVNHPHFLARWGPTWREIVRQIERPAAVPETI